MDMAVNGSSKYADSSIKRKGIFEPQEVDIGYEFIIRLITLRLRQEESRPATLEERQSRFKRDKNLIAQQMGYDAYVSLPKDAKSFESRCSAIQRANRRMSFSDIARDERRYNERVCEDLYRSIMEELSFHVPKWTEHERRYLLVRRMCCLHVPHVFKPG